MNEQTILAICYIIVVIISALAGFLGREILYNRKSIKDLRERISDSLPNSGELEGSKRKFEDTIAEIRKNGQAKE